MKKAYSKPHIIFDSFELSQSIASCNQTTNAVMGACAYWAEEWSMNIFVSTVSACEVCPLEEGNYNGLCYEVPTGSWNLFSS